MPRPLAAAVVAVMLAVPAAYAQADPAGTARAAAANQLGVLQYCQDQGHTGPDAVQAERDMMARMPPSGASTSDAEAMGKSGTVAMPNGQQVPLANVASAQNVSVATVCKQMADATVGANDAFKRNGASAGGIPGLPAISGTPGVPGLQPMSGLPGVSGTPTAPAR